MAEKLNRNKWVLLVIVLLLAVIGVLVFVMVTQFMNRDTDGRVGEGFSLETHTIENFHVGDGPRTVNLRTEIGGAHQFVTINITLGVWREIELNRAEFIDLTSSLRRRETVIWGNVVEILSGMTYEEVEGQAGQDYLAEVIAERLNEVFETNRIERVLFTQFSTFTVQ